MSTPQKKNPAFILKSYMKRHNIPAYRLALKCHISTSTLNGALRENRIGQNAAYKIEKFTKGEIKFDDLTDIPMSHRNQVNRKARKIVE